MATFGHKNVHSAMVWLQNYLNYMPLKCNPRSETKFSSQTNDCILATKIGTFWIYYFDSLCEDEDLRLDALEDFRWDWCCDRVLVHNKIPLMEMQITLANKWPVDVKYRYITGNPTNRYKTVKSLERELTAQSWPHPEK